MHIASLWFTFAVEHSKQNSNHQQTFCAHCYLRLGSSITPFQKFHTFFLALLAGQCDRSSEHVQRSSHSQAKHICHIRPKLPLVNWVVVLITDSKIRTLVDDFKVHITASLLSPLLSPFSFTVISSHNQWFLNFLTFPIGFPVEVSTILPYVSPYPFLSASPTLFILHQTANHSRHPASRLEIDIITTFIWPPSFHFGLYLRKYRNASSAIPLKKYVSISAPAPTNVPPTADLPFCKEDRSYPTISSSLHSLVLERIRDTYKHVLHFDIFSSLLLFTLFTSFSCAYAIFSIFPLISHQMTRKASILVLDTQVADTIQLVLVLSLTSIYPTRIA